MEKIKLKIPNKQPRGVFEHFISGDIEITDHILSISVCKLDKKGISRFNYYSSKYKLEIVCGIARLCWKSQNDRINCIEIQKSKNKNRPSGKSRWTEITSMVKDLKKGDILPLTALVCPILNQESGLLIIDGARRIIANIEAAKVEFKVIIIKPTAVDPIA